MAWLIEALGGPVLAWEVKQATRRKLWRYLPIGYCAWLVIQAVVLFRTLPVYPDLPSSPRARLELFRMIYAQQMALLDNYLVLLLQVQLVLIMATIPALTASSLGQEKDRGTLFALFGTALTSRQILLGKLLGRLILIMPLALSTLPALVFLANLSGRGLTPVILALVQEVILALAMGAASLLFGIWIRRAADATIASYLFLSLAYVIIRVSTVSLPEAFWFDPFNSLRDVLSGGSWLVLAAHMVFWAFLGLSVCTWVGRV